MRIIRVDLRRADLTALYYWHFIRLECGLIKRVNLKNTDLLVNMLIPINFSSIVLHYYKTKFQ